MTQIKNNLEQLLTIPGNGVHTIHTAKDKKMELWNKLYQTSDEEKIIALWKQNIQKSLKESHSILLGICSDNGGGIHRGANWGPLFVREKLYEKVEKNNFIDIGDTRVIPHLLDDKYINDKTLKSCREALYGNANIELPVSPLSIAKKSVQEIYATNKNQVIIGIGGDHSVSYPLVSEYLIHKKAQNKRVAIIHFDAHTDLLEKRLGIDICFGSWAFHIIDKLQDPSDLYQIGIRSSGQNQKFWEDKYKIQQFWADEVIDTGSSAVATKIINDLKKKNIEEIYISFDIDAIDAKFAAATGTPEINGPAPHHLISIIHQLCLEFKLTGADLVEVAPYVNSTNDMQAKDNTLEIASDIVKIFIDYAKNKNKC